VICSAILEAAERRFARGSAPLTAYVLHRYDWSESSLILDLFTLERGRLAVVAKGAKRPYSQLRPVLLPFQRIQVTLTRAAANHAAFSEVQTLRGAERLPGAAMLTGAALFTGFYVNELVMKMVARDDPHPALFEAYANTLPRLNQAQDPCIQAALRSFELKLLQQVGLLPDLSVVTLTQEPVQALTLYELLPEEQGVVALQGRGEGILGGALTGLQAALDHGSLAALQQACEPCLLVLKTTLRALIQHHLGAHGVLRTRQVMAELQAL
jgi:DNA repair protein RecO (recombination protein O)